MNLTSLIWNFFLKQENTHKLLILNLTYKRLNICNLRPLAKILIYFLLTIQLFNHEKNQTTQNVRYCCIGSFGDNQL